MWKLKKYHPTLLIAVALVLSGGACSQQSMKSRSLARANRDFQSERYSKAEIEYLAVLRSAPDEVEAIGKLGLLYYLEGRFAQACVFLQKTCEMQPANFEARAKLGLAHLSLRDFKDAREEGLFLLDHQSENADALMLLASTALSSNLVAETAQRFETLPEKLKSTVGYHIAMGSFLSQQHLLDKAEAEFRRAAAVDPKSSEACVGLADIALGRNKIQEAEDLLKRGAELGPLRSPARLHYADFKVRIGEVEAGKQIAQELTVKAPDYIPAWTFLARLTFAQQRFDECGSFVKTILAKDPINLDALTLNGDLFLAKDDTTNAIAQFERILGGLYKKAPQVQCRLAIAQIQNGEPANAVTTLNQLLADDPNNPQAVLLLASLNLSKGDASPAVASLTRLVGQQPQIPQAYLLLARAYLLQGRTDQATDVYRRMSELFPGNPEAPHLIGLTLTAQDKREEARKAFEHSLEISPGYLPSIESLVGLDILDKNYVAAMGRVQNDLQKNPRSAGLWLLRAKILLVEALGDSSKGSSGKADAAPPQSQASRNPAAEAQLKDAEEAATKAIQLDPGLDASYLLLARLYVASNKYQEALDRLSSFVAKTNDVAALMQIGVIQEQLHNFPAARDAYEKILSVNPRFSVALNNLAYLYSERLGQMDNAYKMAESARRLMPYEPRTADTLGWILHRRGEYNRALGLLEESALKLPDEPEVQFHLGMVHYMLGEERTARLALETAIHSSKDFPEKQEGSNCLRLLSLDIKNATPQVVSELEKRLGDVPNDPVAFSRLGAIQERDGAVDKAAQTYERALQQNPQNPQFMLQLAKIYFSGLNKPDRARDLARAAHRLAPDDPEICHLLGQIAYCDRDYSWAASLLEESARRLPSDPQVAYDLAWCYYSLGRLAEAQTKMQSVVQSGPSFAHNADAKRFLRLVPASDDITQAQTAEPEARQVLEHEPDDVPANMVSAMLEETRGNYAPAAKLYDRILGVSPAFTPAMKRLAILNLNYLHNEQRANELAKKVRESGSSDPEMAKVLGIVAFHAGDYAQAAQLLEESARQRTTDPDLLYYLGMAHYELKETATSRAALQRALELNLRADLAGQAKRALSDLK